MANIYGKNFSATDGLKKASGSSHDAGIRRFSNSVDLAVEGGGGTNALLIGVKPRGTVFDSATIASTANISALNFTIGTAADPDKYQTTIAGPNAVVKPNLGLPAMRAEAPSTEDEEIFLTPSGNLPASGILEASFYVSKR